MQFPRRGVLSSHLERGVGDVVGQTVSWGLWGTNGQEVIDTGHPQPHLVAGPAHQRTEVHLSLGSVAHHAHTGQHRNIGLLRNSTLLSGLERSDRCCGMSFVIHRDRYSNVLKGII